MGGVCLGNALSDVLVLGDLTVLQEILVTASNLQEVLVLELRK